MGYQPMNNIITWQVIAPWLLFELFFMDRGTPRAETLSLCQNRKPILVARFGREWHFGQELETRPFGDGVLFILRVERKRKILSPFVSIFLPSSDFIFKLSGLLRTCNLITGWLLTCNQQQIRKGKQKLQRNMFSEKHTLYSDCATHYLPLCNLSPHGDPIGVPSVIERSNSLLQG